MDIKTLNGYREFMKVCGYEPCGKNYPGWVGREKYIVISDLPDDKLKARFPEIMSALSPYVLVGTYYRRINDRTRYNEEKHASVICISINSTEDFEDLSDQFLMPSHEEEIIFAQQVKEALKSLTDVQRSRFSRWAFAGFGIEDIARQDKVSIKAVFDSIEQARKKLQLFFG